MKRLKTDYFRSSIIGYIIIAMFLFTLLSVATTWIVQQYRYSHLIEKYENDIHTSVHYTIKNYFKFYKSTIETLSKNEKVIAYLEQNRREELSRYLEKQWNSLQEEQPYVKVLQFHLKNGNSFLRMHNREKFGDRLDDKRAMIKEIHQNHQLISGYETGLYATTYRIIAPIFNQNREYIGAVEIGLNPNFILNDVYEINHFLGMVFIKESDLQLYSQPNDIIVDHYRLQSNKEPALESIYRTLMKENKFVNGVKIATESQKYLTHIFTLNDFRGHEKVKILFLQDISHVGEYRNSVIYGLLISIVLIFFTLILKINRKIDEFHQSIETIYKEQLDELNRSKEEVVQSQQHLKTLFERLEYATNSTNDGLWDWNVASDEVYFSPRWKAMLGYKDWELPNRVSSWEEMLHPEEKEWVLHEIALCHKDPHREYAISYRLAHKDGHWIWVLDRGQTLFDEKNKPIRMVGFHTDISQQKELEQELRASKTQFERFMDNVPYEVVIKDENQRVVYENARVKKFRNDSPQMQKVVDELLEELQKVPKAERVVSLKENEQTSVARVLVFAIPQMNAQTFTGYIYADITKEYIVKDEIRKLKSALENSPIMVMRTNLLGEIEYVNSSYTKVSGYSAQELYGQNPRIVKSGDTDVALYKKMWHEIKSGHAWMFEIKNRAKDGSFWWENSTILPSFNEDGEVDGYIAFKVEITEKVQLQQKLHEQEEMMLAQSRNAAMGEMISMIAHQWRQPISVIAMGANNILVDIELDILDIETLKQEAHDIISQTQELSKTIDDFRNFFRSDKQAQEVAIKEVIDDALHVIGKSLENNEVKLSMSIDNTLKINTYPRELMQVLINIIKNAKEVLIDKSVSQKYIDIAVEDIKSDLKITICDNGGGISQEILSEIFNPYFSTKGEKNGTGLGLYISKTIIEKHLYGAIRALNRDDGACFEIILPYREFKDIRR